MTDDTGSPGRVISRRKARPKGPQAQTPGSDYTPEYSTPESAPSGSNTQPPVKNGAQTEKNYEAESPAPAPEPQEQFREEPEEEPQPEESPVETAEEFAREVNPSESIETSTGLAGTSLPLAEPESVETQTQPGKKGKKEKKKKEKKEKTSRGKKASTEEPVEGMSIEESVTKKRLSRKERKAIKEQETNLAVLPGVEMPEKKRSFSIFRFSQKRESLVKARAEIEENQRKLFGIPKKTDAVSIQKMTQPISRRVEFVTAETTAPQVPTHMKIALALFRDYYTLRPVNTKLEESLRKSKMPYSTVQYQSVVMLTTILVICIGLIALGVAYYFFGEPVLFGIPIVVLGAVALYVLVLNVPASKINKRRKNIEARLPMALAYIATMASADIPVEHIMYELGKTTEYGEIAKEARAISASSRLFGNDIVTALREEAKYSPSGKLAEFLSGITSTVTSGGNLKDYFTMKAKQFQSELSTLIKQNAESVGVLAESYVTVGVAFPLMFIVILGVLVAMTPNASAIVLLLYLMVLMMIPLITFVFAFIIQSTVREVPI